MKRHLCLFVLLFSFLSLQAQTAKVLENGVLRVEVDAYEGRVKELLSVKSGGLWVRALDGSAFLHLRTSTDMHLCALQKAERIPSGLLLSGDCGIGTFEQRIHLSPEPDVLNVATRLMLNKGASVKSVEDRYEFVPPKHDHIDEHTGPLDFIWSQNIKREGDDLIPTSGFKCTCCHVSTGNCLRRPDANA